MAKEIKYMLVIRGVPADIHTALEKAARAENRTKSGQVRHILESWAAKLNEEKPS